MVCKHDINLTPLLSLSKISYPLNKLFNDNYYGMIIPEKILQNNKNYIELLFSISHTSRYSTKNIGPGWIWEGEWKWTWSRYQKTFTEIGQLFIDFGTYDILD